MIDYQSSAISLASMWCLYRIGARIVAGNLGTASFADYDPISLCQRTLGLSEGQEQWRCSHPLSFVEWDGKWDDRVWPKSISSR